MTEAPAAECPAAPGKPSSAWTPTGILEDVDLRALEAGTIVAAELILVEYADEIVLLFTDVQMPGDRDGLPWRG